ncbi:MAG: type II toxin-antitoxin system HicA family toxin [Candidatus Latescibacterota bacterium]
MKRADLLRHLAANGCELLREESRHTVFVNRAAGRSSTVPRHREIDEFLARRICKDLQIPPPER